jgi:hypothetical protein
VKQLFRNEAIQLGCSGQGPLSGELPPWPAALGPPMSERLLCHLNASSAQVGRSTSGVLIFGPRLSGDWIDDARVNDFRVLFSPCNTIRACGRHVQILCD